MIPDSILLVNWYITSVVSPSTEDGPDDANRSIQILLNTQYYSE